MSITHDQCDHAATIGRQMYKNESAFLAEQICNLRRFVHEDGLNLTSELPKWRKVENIKIFSMQ